ncbi:MAG: DNA polymerase I [bacterium]|nr:DNA polymerase I [bacterium]
MASQFDPKKTIFLIDGSSVLYRGYYGVRPLHTSQGVAIQAVYNFCRMTKKLLDRFNPEYIAIVWDSKGKTTRHEMYELYKATRQAPPSDLFEQKKRIIEFADFIGIAQVEKPGVEADDLMFSIAKDRTDEGDISVIVTTDKDMGQAISNTVYVYDPLKDQIFDSTAFEEKMGFPVAQMPFYFALLGDISDNIPGVRGIGEKTAFELVKQFDSLEDLYMRIGEVKKGSVKTALLENKTKAFLSQALFLLQYHTTGLTKNDLAYDSNNWKKARPLFQELEFKSLLKDLGEAEERTDTVEDIIAQLKKNDFQLVITPQQLDDLCALLKQKKIIAFDTETNGLNSLNTDLVGISFCVQEGQAFYIPCMHNTGEQQLSLDQVRAKLKPIFEDPTIKKYAHNIKFDQHVLATHGMELKGTDFDSLVAASLLVKSWQSPGLKKISLYYFNEPMLTFEQVIKQNKFKDFSYVPLDLALYYSANDSHQTFKCAQLLQQELKKEKLDKLYNEIEFPLIQVLYDMEREGIYVDKEALKRLDREITKGLSILEHEILTLIDGHGKGINFNSPKQMQELLFEHLKLPLQKKSAKGTGYSTDQEVLRELAKRHPVPGLILKYRELFKLKSTYVDALPTYINPKTGRIHTTFSQTRVATGRLASSDPNLQNVPADSGYGSEIRAAFKPKNGHVFISADYSQIELRVLAYLSQDENLVNAFLKDQDIHTQTAAHLFDVPLDAVTHAQRQIGKRINFSILYGLTPFGLSKDLEIPFKDAKLYIEKYFGQYPMVSSWMETVINQTKENGYVTTFWGRRRDIPAIYEKNKALYEEARRIAINTKAQGTAAEIMKQGMISLDRAFKKHKLDTQMLLQIHDELLITVSKEHKDEAEKIIKEVLESVVDWNVPLKVALRSGANWKEVSK